MVLIALAASAWLALIVFAPFLPVPLAGIAYLAGSLICHQLPERSFHIGGVQLVVCARCVGIYAGAMAATLTGRRVSRLTPKSILMVGALPTVVTVALEWTALWSSSNLVRFFAGAPLGFAVAFVVAAVHYEPCAPRRPIAPRPPPTPI
jgi:uncharacterized membrane protein